MINLIEPRIRDNLIKMNGVYSVLLYLYLYVGLRGGQIFSTVHAPNKRTRSTDTAVSDNHTTKLAIPMQCGGKPHHSLGTHAPHSHSHFAFPFPSRRRRRLERSWIARSETARNGRAGAAERDDPISLSSATLRSFLPQSSPHRVQLAKLHPALKARVNLARLVSHTQAQPSTLLELC
jgi:hypothetical protein